MRVKLSMGTLYLFLLFCPMGSSEEFIGTIDTLAKKKVARGVSVVLNSGSSSSYRLKSSQIYRSALSSINTRY